MLQGYFDSSGTKSHGVVSLAGFSTDVLAWTKFSDDWDAALKRHHLKVFKMQLESKRPTLKRNDRIADFLDIIRKHVPMKLESSISIPEFDSAVTQAIDNLDERLRDISPRVAALAKQLLDDIYFWLIGNLVAGFCKGAWDRGFREPFDLFFDTQILEMCPGAPALYDIIKTIIPLEFQKMLPEQLISRNDIQFRPLQAADMFSWITRRQHEKNTEGWEWLIQELDKIETIPCRFVDARMLRPQISAFYAYVLGQTPRFSQALIDRWSKFVPQR